MNLPAWAVALLIAGLVLLVVITSAVAAPTPEPPPPAAAPTSGDYRLHPGDVVRIEVYLQPDLATTATLDSQGNVRLPLVDTVSLAGQTVAEAQRTIEAAYRDREFLRKPHVSLRIEAHLAQEVTVSGQVRAPGRYSLPPEGTFSVVDLILKAGGLTDLARGGAVVLTRLLPNGEKRTTQVDATRLLRGLGDPKAPELRLQPGDIVFVPERIF